MARPTRAIVDLDALRHNYDIACQLSGQGYAMPVVKANAYGHGAVAVARALDQQAPAFGVACIEEALELRAAGVQSPILLMEGFFSDDELELAAEQQFWLMIQNQEQLTALNLKTLSAPVTCWLKLDTGMHRLGFKPEQAPALLQTLKNCHNVHDEVVLATHFACADDLDNDFTQRQIDEFTRATANLGCPLSLANSPGLLGWPTARADWNRPGFMLYGQSPFVANHAATQTLIPVMHFCSAVMAVREVHAGDSVGYANTWTARCTSRIATVPVGYGDGYPRHAPNGTPVLINGHKAFLAGRVSMDMITVDVTHIDSVSVGDPVTLWGPELAANEVAAHASTIGYEIMTRLHNRVPRVTINTP